MKIRISEDRCCTHSYVAIRTSVKKNPRFVLVFYPLNKYGRARSTLPYCFFALSAGGA